MSDGNGCPLSGAKLLNDLENDIKREFFSPGIPLAERRHKDGDILRARYLCVDIDNLKNFADYNGLPQAERCIASLGNSLVSAYSAERVYRYDGDGFVVHLGNEGPHGVPKKLFSDNGEGEVNCKFSFVEIKCECDHDRHHQLTKKNHEQHRTRTPRGDREWQYDPVQFSSYRLKSPLTRRLQPVRASAAGCAGSRRPSARGTLR